VSDASAGGADFDRRISPTVAGAGTPSSRAPVVIRVSASSTRASVAIGGTVCKSGSDVGDCVVALGMPVRSSALSSASSSLQTVFA
jgi:hypothetical protein